MDAHGGSSASQLVVKVPGQSRQTFCAVFFKGLGLEYGPWELQFQPPICGNNYMSLKRDSGGSWLSPFALLLGTKEGCS